MTENEFKTGETKPEKSKARAKYGNLAMRDFHLFLPPQYDLQIKEGDDLDKLNLPDNLLENLRTEKVMKG